jgi:hypothetical protein
MSPIEADWGMNARRGGITGGLRFRHPCPIAGARRQRGTWCATASVKRARAPTMSAGAARAADVTCSVRLLKVRRKPARAFAGARHRGWRACCFLSQSGRGCACGTTRSWPTPLSSRRGPNCFAKPNPWAPHPGGASHAWQSGQSDLVVLRASVGRYARLDSLSRQFSNKGCSFYE